MLVTPWLLAATLALIVAASIPTRRLSVAGAGRGTLATYLVGLVALGLVGASGLGLERLFVLCFVAAFAVPLVAPPGLIRRVLRRGRRPAADGRPRGG